MGGYKQENTIANSLMDVSSLWLPTGHDCSVRLWNFESRTCVQEITSHRKKFDEAIFDVTFHPTRPYFASGGADALSKVFVWHQNHMRLALNCDQWLTNGSTVEPFLSINANTKTQLNNKKVLNYFYVYIYISHQLSHNCQTFHSNKQTNKTLIYLWHKTTKSLNNTYRRGRRIWRIRGEKRCIYYEIRRRVRHDCREVPKSGRAPTLATGAQLWSEHVFRTRLSAALRKQESIS